MLRGKRDIVSEKEMDLHKKRKDGCRENRAFTNQIHHLPFLLRKKIEIQDVPVARRLDVEINVQFYLSCQCILKIYTVFLPQR